MLFDSHCHLNFSSFADDYQQVIADCLKKEIGVVNVGSQIDTSTRAIEIANEYVEQPIYASIGIHPIHLSNTEVDEEETKFKSREEKFEVAKYQNLIDQDKNKKIVAVGEIGLDYWHMPVDKDTEQVKQIQKKGFIDQLDFADQNNLPVILHARGSKENPNDAYEDMLNILKSRDATRLDSARQVYGVSEKSTQCDDGRDTINGVSTGDKKEGVVGVIHCYGSDLDIAQKFLALGFYIGFTGIITFKNKSVDSLREVVKNVPLDKILVETDAPYLSPEPFRGQTNSPLNVEFVARKVAEVKNESYDKICQQTTENFKKLFGIK